MKCEYQCYIYVNNSNIFWPLSFEWGVTFLPVRAAASIPLWAAREDSFSCLLAVKQMHNQCEPSATKQQTGYSHMVYV